MADETPGRVASTLTEIRERQKAASKRSGATWTDIQKSQADTPALLAAVEAALKVHQPVDRGTGAQCKGCATHVTFTRWPCPTVRVITAALAGTQPSEDENHD